MRSIIVIGYARSGTSLTAGVLHELGVDMGDKRVWRKTDEANEKGYFENSQFVRANQAILETGKVPDLQKVVDKNKGEIWGAKDPRFLQTWEHWEPYIENPHFIFCMRRIGSIAESVCSRDNGKYSPEKVYNDVIADVYNYYHLIAKIKGFPFLSVQYEDYFDNDKQIKKIAKFIGLPYKDIDLPDINLKHF